MPAKQKTITLGTLTVIVSEVSVTQIYRLLQGETSLWTLPLTEAMAKVKEIIPLALDITPEQLLQEEIFSEDLDNLYAAIKETNPTFFTIARTLRLDTVLAEMIPSLLGSFSQRFSGLLAPAMTAPESGSTVTATSTISSQP